MDDNDAEALTIGDYLIKLLSMLWYEGESFSGKRPFGNSGWEYDLYKALVAAGVVSGKVDDEGDLEVVDATEANTLIGNVISSLYQAPK